MVEASMDIMITSWLPNVIQAYKEMDIFSRLVTAVGFLSPSVLMSLYFSAVILYEKKKQRLKTEFICMYKYIA